MLWKTLCTPERREDSKGQGKRYNNQDAAPAEKGGKNKGKGGDRSYKGKDRSRSPNKDTSSATDPAKKGPVDPKNRCILHNAPIRGAKPACKFEAKDCKSDHVPMNDEDYKKAREALRDRARARSNTPTGKSKGKGTKSNKSKERSQKRGPRGERKTVSCCHSFRFENRCKVFEADNHDKKCRFTHYTQADYDKANAELAKKMPKSIDGK